MTEDLSQLGPEYIQLIDGQIVRRDAEEWAREREKVVCRHPRKVVQDFTYGYWWHCPDCGAVHEDWWD